MSMFIRGKVPELRRPVPQSYLGWVLGTLLVLHVKSVSELSVVNSRDMQEARKAHFIVE